MESSPTTGIDARQCPLCCKPNRCQLSTDAAYKGPCWCEELKFPDKLLMQVPPDLRNKACICRDCVADFNRLDSVEMPPKVLPGDFYFHNGLMVFTEQYHLRRGHCCGSNCRHCPYSK